MWFMLYIFSFKQFQNFQGIDECLRIGLLNKVQQGELSLTQAGAEAKLCKQLDTVRKAFVSATDSPSWTYAKQRYPTIPRTKGLNNLPTTSLSKEVVYNIQIMFLTSAGIENWPAPLVDFWLKMLFSCQIRSK
jgi:hypothetical protein